MRRVRRELPGAGERGFQCFYNMLGKPAPTVPGARELTPIVTFTIHLPTGHSAK